MSYSIESLDVYRKSVAAAAGLCSSSVTAGSKGHPALAAELERRAVLLVANLADGLGFWEKEEKVQHFASSKRAVLESLPLLEMMMSLGLMSPETNGRLAEELRDLAKMINGLLRGARRREREKSQDSRADEAGGEEKMTCH